MLIRHVQRVRAAATPHSLLPMLKVLPSTDKKDHLRVDVNGKAEGDTIQVESLKMM